jgi:outer membrane protein TolC
VENKYLTVLRLKTIYELSQAELNTARENQELALLKLQTGLIAQGEFLRFKANTANKEVAELQAQTALQLALQDFANYLNSSELLLPLELDLENDQELIDRLRSYTLGQTQELVNKALQLVEKQNLNLKILDKTTDLSDRAYKIAKASFLPTVVLSGSRKYEENGIDRYEFTPSDQIMLNASIPLFPLLGSYANLKKAKTDIQRTRLEAKSVSDAIRLSTQSAVINWVSAAKQVNGSELALQYSEQLYQQLRERYNQNMLSSVDLLDAELMLSAARLTATNAYFSFYLSRSALMQVLAMEDPASLEAILN